MFVHHWLMLIFTSYQVTCKESFKVTGHGNVTTIEGNNTILSCEASNELDRFNQCSFNHNDRSCTFLLDKDKLWESGRFEAQNEICPEFNAKFIGSFDRGKTFKICNKVQSNHFPSDENEKLSCAISLKPNSR